MELRGLKYEKCGGRNITSPEGAHVNPPPPSLSCVREQPLLCHQQVSGRRSQVEHQHAVTKAGLLFNHD